MVKVVKFLVQFLEKMSIDKIEDGDEDFLVQFYHDFKISSYIVR